MLDDDKKTILIDFGLTHKYASLENGENKHIPYQLVTTFKGTWYFSSLNQV